MNTDFIPIWLLFLGTVLIVMLSIEAGYRLGHRSHRKSGEEKESPVSAIAGSVLGLSAFLLAFTFGIVSDRYDSRKALVREEANIIGTTYLRADFLPEDDRAVAKSLLKEYVSNRIGSVESLHSGRMTPGEMEARLAKVSAIHKVLWDMAVTNARKDMNSDVAALYIDSLNSLIDIHALRIAVGLQARIPRGIWFALSCLTALGMASIGYQTGIAGSKRSIAKGVLAIAFSLVIALIASLDRPQGSYVTVSQQPLIDVLKSMDSTSN
ncbi:hypothetical protein JIN84_11230 [Luteolibacter yonseiensis]|uniref:DUF4239 domain-containing protein n=1 Tax=Luteolibacter yonseiensis TaxID=1144680 RepID=A0A934VBI8_9BACT|nr:hypothetical protein [Luteolibacter yonseiensis]MBK1816185.1 hypothetical protein [Luteolibacter yonseiensis]